MKLDDRRGILMVFRRQSEMQTIRGGLRCANYEGVFAIVHIALTQGVFLTTYILHMGATNILCGVVEALPFLLQITVFLSPLLVRRLRSRKRVSVTFSVIHRSIWIILVLLLFVNWSTPWKLTVLIATLVISHMCATISGNAWQSWMTDLVPASIRGSYYGRRSAYLGLTSLVTLFVGTQVLSMFEEHGAMDAGFAIVFTVAIASAMYAAWLLSRQYEPVGKPVSRVSLSELSQLVRQRPLFRTYVRFFMT
jgi:hypothetical protein